MMEVLTIFGTRPEAIKLAPVIAEMRSRGGEIRSRVCVTAQHRTMLDQVLEWFGITHDFDLGLMEPGQELCDFAGRAFPAIRGVLDCVDPDLVLVQGDTTTTLVAALAAFYRGLPVGHVEAGLRTRDLANPFPEELNRRVVGLAARYHFAPTPRAANALLEEQIPPDRIFITGNTVIDALRMTLARPVPMEHCWDEDGRRILLVTAHRRESFGGPLEAVCRALRRLAERHPDIQIIYPVHLNPNVREPVNRILKGHPRIQLLEPLRYEQFVHLMARAYLILTDSGGIQEEAPFLHKPALVMRDTTERPEALEVGTAVLVGTSEAQIIAGCESLLVEGSDYQRMARGGSPFGDGRAAARIVDVLLGKGAETHSCSSFAAASAA